MPLLSFTRTFFVLGGLLGAASCSLGTKQSAGIRAVDDLVSQVETVQIEAEVSRQVVFETLRSLHPLVADGFDGDAAAAYVSFVKAVEQSEAQAVRFAKAVGPMESAAASVYERWEANLGQFRGDAMRARSQQRLDEDRARYDAVLGNAIEAQEQLEHFNAGMQDLVLFLGIDLNPTSVDAIEGESRGMAVSGKELRETFDECSKAAKKYVLVAAPLGQLEVDVQPKKDAQPKD